MKEITVDEMKEIQLKILIDIADFCEKNNLRYFLCGGTLLGAVRHKGFIPWDDDIDISMPRPDYERLLQTYSHPDYTLFHWQKGGKYLGTFTKAADRRTIIDEKGDFGEEIGVNIDIFPIDGLPGPDKKNRAMIRKFRFLYRIVCSTMAEDLSNRTFFKKIAISAVKGLDHIFPIRNAFTKMVVKGAQKYPFDTAEKVAAVVWGYGEREIVDRDVYSHYIKLDFEGYQFNVPQKYDTYLKMLYGDYMALPPKEQQVYKHGATAYWKE